MSECLLALSIGPVQEFIAAARRTRDLWFGSHLLSEISREAALAVKAGGGELIFPTEQDASDKAAIANVILAALPAGADPKELAKKTKEAAQQCWLEFARKAHAAADERINEDLWKAQVGDVIEFYAAWAPHDDPQKYKDDRARVMRLLAGRKACRDFFPAQPSQGRQGVLKSSLDGRRESVLKKTDKPSSAGKLRLAQGEQLCAVALTKRLAGNHPFPSVARIAADPWLRGVVKAADVSEKVREAFKQLKNECEKLPAIHRLDTQRFPQFKDFPFEGTSVYPSRFHEWETEWELTKGDLKPLRDAVQALQNRDLDLGEPDPYLAVLVADGDRMGAAISTIDNAEEHRKLSCKLTEFANAARSTVEKHSGVCVYAGGDDVLAFLPVDKALACACLLHETFGCGLSEFKHHNATPTLSVGIAIGHFMEPLEDLRAYGQQAEKAAKSATPDAGAAAPFAERNGLAVMVHPRGGVEFGVREQWQGGGEALDKRLDRLAQLFAARQLPNKLPYDLRELAWRLKGWPAPAEAVQAEASLLFKRKQAKEEARAELAERLRTCDTAQVLERLAEEMLVSQWISAAQR